MQQSKFGYPHGVELIFEVSHGLVFRVSGVSSRGWAESVPSPLIVLGLNAGPSQSLKIRGGT